MAPHLGIYICGTVLGHVAVNLNTLLARGAQMYTSLKFSFPYSLFRIVNTIVSAIVEVKLRVGIKLTDADKKDLAQPFLKVFYLQKMKTL